MLSHRATTSTGAVVDDPTPAQLARLVTEVAHAGRGAFVILERHADLTGQTFVQAMHEADGWALEVRVGNADRHYRVTVADDAAVTATVASWQVDSADWIRLAWQHMPRETWVYRDARHLAGAR